MVSAAWDGLHERLAGDEPGLAKLRRSGDLNLSLKN